MSRDHAELCCHAEGRTPSAATDTCAEVPLEARSGEIARQYHRRGGRRGLPVDVAKGSSGRSKEWLARRQR